MLDIDKDWIKELAGEIIYKRGYNCYENNQIKEFSVDYENEDGNIIIKVNATVKSSSTNDEYTVNINLVNGVNNVRLNCNCKYWGVFCKHSVAVLLKLIEEKDNILEKLKDKHDKSFLMDIKHNIIEKNLNIEKKYLNISYKLHIENIKMHTVSLEIKVGEDKQYVVKNIKEFIEKVSCKEDIYFGKGFILNPYVHTFREDDEKIINFLIETYEIQNKLEEFADIHNQGVPLNSKLLKGKKIYLTESNIIKFFNILRHRKIGLKIYDEDMGEVEIVKEDFPLDFIIKLEEDRICLKQLSKLAIPITRSGEFLLYENKIYEPTTMLLKNYRPFFNAFINSNSPEISIDKKYSEDMASYVLPALRKISNNINIDESFKEKFYEEKLQTIIYLDKDKGKVIAKFLFQYDDIKINPLSKKKDKRKEDRVLIRDLKREEEVLNVFKLYGFVIENSTYVLENEEKILQFILSGMESLQKLGEVYYSESFKNIKVYNSSNYRSSIKLNDEDLLEFSFSIDGIDKRELKDIFKSIREKKKYHRLKEGGFISLVDNSIKDIAKLMSRLNINPSQLEKNSIILPKYNALYLDNCLREKEINFVEKNKSFRELINNIKDIGDTDYEVPSNLNTIMRPYQKFGFKWLKTLSYCRLGGILADEMGLGKTLQSIAFIKSEVDENKNRKPSIVICPTSLVYNWQDEINKFEPNLKCLVISGNKEEREKQVELIKEVDVVITSYSLIRRDIQDYQNIDFRYCFLDEAQNIKNANSLSAQSVKCINAEARFALTGTPIENSIKELWSIFDFIMPGYLFTITKFAQKYEVPIIRNNNEELLEDLSKKIKPFILRRLKKNVIKELPPKIEHNVMVDMSEEQKKVYASFVHRAKEEMEHEIQENGFNKSKIKILAILTRLRQICCDPSTFIEDFNGESGKMEAVLNIINNNISEGHKILIFSQFTSVLKNLSKKLEDNSVKYLYLDGSTKAEDRGKLVKEFNESNIGVFLISLKAGGTGLNLTSADIVIHFDPWWNPAVENQASDRAHRIGQKNTVEVIRLIAKGTIEEKIYKIQEKKKKIIENVIDKNVGEELLISSLEKDDIEQLFL